MNFLVIMERKTCFVIAPIDEEGSSTRERTDSLIHLIRDAIGDDFEVEISHEIEEAGDISKQVIERLINYDLIIADLTDKNASVYYEIGVRQTTFKHIIYLAEKPIRDYITFYIQRSRIIEYDLDEDIEDFKDSLTNYVDNIDFNEKDDNPLKDFVAAKWWEDGQELLDYIADEASSSASGVTSSYNQDNESY